MRKLLPPHNPPVLPPSSLTSFLPPAPAPFDPHPIYTSWIFPNIPNRAFDFATLSLIAALVLFSAISLSFVLHLRFRFRRLHQRFNYLWTVRLLLVTFAFLWALNELLPLPIFRRDYLYPFWPPLLTLDQQANLCKVHVVLSLGFFQPGFLVTLLFLVTASIQKPQPSRMCSLATSACVSCSPILLLQAIFVFYAPFETHLPDLIHGSSVLTIDMLGKQTVLCTYPFFSCAIFGAFAIAYSLGFLISCWRVVSLAINKSIRARIDLLVWTLMITLPVQILCLAMTFLWSPDELAYSCVVLAMFFCVAGLLVVGLVILVIKPITDALAAAGGGGSCSDGRE